MDEVLKLQKLAAARNKLKSHQQKKSKKSDDTPTDPPNAQNESILPASNVSDASSQRSSSSPGLQNTDPPNPIQSYFNASAPPVANFFDNVKAERTSATFTLEPMAHESQTFVSNNTTNMNVIEPDSVAFEDPEITPNIIQTYADQKGITEQLIQINKQISKVTNGGNNNDFEQKCFELTEYQKRVEELENEIALRKQQEEEMHAHKTTVQILVNEKTELTHSLYNTEVHLKEKMLECEELQARLKNSRSLVVNLEKEVSHLKEESGKYAQMHNGHSQDYNKIQEELKELEQLKGETEQDLCEMRQKNKILEGENDALGNKCKELKGKLELANVKIQQLTAGIDSPQNDTFVQEKQQLEKKITDLETSLTSALSDREQSGNQYQYYVQQLNLNIASLNESLETSYQEKDNLLKREQELVMHIGDLERRLQSVQQETANIYKSQHPSDNRALNEEVETLRLKLKESEVKIEDLANKFASVKVERDEFIKEVEQKKLSIEDLESLIERLQSNQGNSVQLLAEIESDKVAASRAMEQNMKLKQQLQEMQEAFIRMTNDKAELLNELQGEQFKRKEVEELQEQTSHQLHTLSEAIEIKDRELTEIRTRQMNDGQLADRLRHYEAHEHSAHSLAQELQRLEVRNKQLEEELQIERKEKLHKKEEAPENDEGALEENISAVLKTNEDSNIERSHEHLTDDALAPHSANPDNQQANIKSPVQEDPNADLSTREIAIRQLETKFMRTMQQCANLHDEKQMLEHLVLQLQGETETIGEYIALYQHQRGVLKQRAIEKETQLKQLARDREQMKRQLHTLNNLIQRLLGEEKIDSVLHEHATALCEEHSKVLVNQESGDIQNHDIQNPGSEGQTQETAKEIMALLGEIKSSNLVQPSDVSDTFHPCPLCSGQLITV